jgi:alpha-amylase/alpha-mannosidase (GH57 family)
MPRRPFAHPDDAAEQLRRGVESHTHRFGLRPRGLWPPEQAVSDDVLRLAADQGIEWMLSDEAILARSLSTSITRDGEGQVMQPDVLYAPYRVQTGGSPIRLLFRDGRLSNAIGFEYQNSTAEEAAKDLVDRLKGIGQRISTRRTVTPSFVPSMPA